MNFEGTYKLCSKSPQMKERLLWESCRQWKAKGTIHFYTSHGWGLLLANVWKDHT